MSYLQVLLILVAVLVVVVIWRYPKKRITLTYPIKLQTMADPFTVVIPAGVRLPYFFSDLFRNAEDHQEKISVSLFQTKDNEIRKIDTITLEGLPPKPVGMLELEIRLMLNRKKQLKVVIKSHDAHLLKEYGPYSVI